MLCQRAVNRKQIPASVIKNRDSWYSQYDIESSFNLKGSEITKLIKQGVLKARTVPREKKGTRFKLFMIKDNKDTLPPKKLVESHLLLKKKKTDRVVSV